MKATTCFGKSLGIGKDTQFRLAGTLPLSKVRLPSLSGEFTVNDYVYVFVFREGQGAFQSRASRFKRNSNNNDKLTGHVSVLMAVLQTISEVPGGTIS